MDTAVIKVIKVRLRHDRGLAEWVCRMSHASRYVYNRAVSTYLFGGDYLNRVVVDLPDHPKYFRPPSGGDRFVSGTLLDVDLSDHPEEFELPRVPRGRQRRLERPVLGGGDRRPKAPGGVVGRQAKAQPGSPDGGGVTKRQWWRRRR